MPSPEVNPARITAHFERSLGALLAIAEDPTAPARERRLAATAVLQATGALPTRQPRLTASRVPSRTEPAAPAARPPLPLPGGAGEGWGEGVTTSRPQRKTPPTESPRSPVNAAGAIAPTSVSTPGVTPPSPSHRITESPSHEATPRATSTQQPAAIRRSPSLLSGFRDLYREVFPTAPIPGRHTDKHPRDG